MMRRFEIWLADLPTAKDSSMKKGRRPVVIVSTDNIYAELPYISVVPLTRDLTSQKLPSHVLLCSRCLDHPSRALCEQVMTLDKSRLRRRIGSVEDPYDRFALNRALAVHLNLTLTTYIKEESLYDTFGDL